jgi:CRP-like cAMP-binding protein
VNESVIEAAWSTFETLRRCAPGTVLFREGEEPRGVFVMHEGIVDLLFSARNGNTKPLRIAEPGQILGLSCVVGARVHDCSATARTPCLAGFIERDVFLRALDENPAIWFNVLRLLSTDVNAVYEDMRALV